MGYMSIRELNANVSKAMAQAEAGDDIILTRNGKPVLRVTREGVDNREAQRRTGLARLRELTHRGISLGGRATYEERTE